MLPSLFLFSLRNEMVNVVSDGGMRMNESGSGDVIGSGDVGGGDCRGGGGGDDSSPLPGRQIQRKVPKAAAKSAARVNIGKNLAGDNIYNDQVLSLFF